MKKISLLFLCLFFSCTSPEHKSKVDDLNQKPEALIDKLLHLTMIETVVPEMKNFEGISDLKEIKDAKLYSFRKISESQAYLILRVSNNGKLISALYYPDKKNELSESEIKEKIKADDWQIKLSYVSKDDRTEKMIVYSMKKRISFGYYKGIDDNHIHFINIGSINESFEVKDQFLY
ncbi:MAG: hypothetical protein PHY93_04725 [Bacteriovorax sp.]|nr:hypothetical protein [Bacteriovorax sp.]